MKNAGILYVFQVFSNCTVGAKDPLITADNFISGYWGFVAADSTYTRYAFVREPSSDRKSLAAGGAERSVGADDPVRPFPQASTAPCRGRCRAQLFATKERYRCGLPPAGTHRPAFCAPILFFLFLRKKEKNRRGVRRSQLHSASAGAAKTPYPLAPSSFPKADRCAGSPFG